MSVFNPAGSIRSFSRLALSSQLGYVTRVRACVRACVREVTPMRAGRWGIGIGTQNRVV